MFFWPWRIFRTFSLRFWFLSGWKWMGKKTDSYSNRQSKGCRWTHFTWKLVTQCRLRISWEHFGGSFEQPRVNLWLGNFWISIGPNFPHIPRLCGRSRGRAGGLYIYIYNDLIILQYITYPKDRRYSATTLVPHLLWFLCVWFSERRFGKNHIEDGGFHIYGGTPIAGWFIMENLITLW